MPDLDREQVREAIADAMKDAGYAIRNDFLEAIYAKVEAAVATSKAERKDVMLSQDALMGQLFIHVPGPTEWTDEDDPVLAEAVYKGLRTKVWTALGTEANKPIQKRLGERNGHWLVRLGGRRGTHVYITSDPDCLWQDYFRPQLEERLVLSDKDGTNAAQLVARVPELEAHVETWIEHQFRQMTQIGQAHLPGLLGNGEDDPSEDGDE